MARRPPRSGLQAQRRPKRGGGGEVAHLEMEMRSGPLPESSELDALERIMPGATDRVFSMAEGHATNSWHNDRSKRILALLGLLGAWILAVAVLGGGVYLLVNGHDIGGYGLLAVSALNLLRVFRR